MMKTPSLKKAQCSSHIAAIKSLLNVLRQHHDSNSSYPAYEFLGGLGPPCKKKLGARWNFLKKKI